MNKIFILSGPSGSGKSTLIRLLLKKYDSLIFSVSHTTRIKRAGEADSREYYFTGPDEFRKMIEKGEFAEWAEVHGEFYGTSINEIYTKSAGDKILILDIDVQGAAIIKKKFPESILVFIKPPSLTELKKRIKKREKELNSVFLKRIKTAEKEINSSNYYDHIIVNDNLEEAFSELEEIFLKYKEKISEKGGIERNGRGS